MHRNAKLALSVLAATSMVALAGCTAAGGDADGDSQSLKIVYQKTDSFTALDELFTKIKPEFEAANPGVTVELEPIQANDDDYSTKLALSQKSAETAPDVFYEDTFRLRSDIDAGYLLNIDDQLADWDEWAQFNEGAKAAGMGDDGSVYAVPLGTDTRGIWYSKPVFAAAGIELPWQPETWDDILTAARAIQDTQPDVVPFNMYAGKGTGEGTVMQSFYELLYGTGDTLYNEDDQKWVVESQGFKDSLEFLETLYAEKLALDPSEALDPNVWKKVFGELFPQGKLGGTVEGSYTPSFWQTGGSYEWPAYTEDMAVATFPTQNGEEPGGVSMSGGWTLAVGAKTANADLAFDFLALAVSQENALWYAINNSQIAVRTDVASEPTYLAANPFVADVTELVDVTHYRPATSDYSKISAEVQAATEAVITGQMSVDEAAAAYDTAVEGIVGADKVTTK
ncbi:multiple sugar transport system substrate-binding protein [Cryobacterium sp. MP_3.1]|uniref:extracellular solute-binding protein n=1 Tax=unclassified Cryobacterium TaxID=2649013 RepID=UPI000B4C6087|nr:MULTISPECIES: extracellular solute-binding protein [unclassified Cryobacterium]ASD21145.1 sugar ABC transporter substrate-binding protein [Cryobacterium sp. LW097]MEC5183072.1 multiple sugar transport system substrate-binding protein [Cryobacterium sp. MP_3.1]TFC85382.1 extracellular solute-binding protein [Cryobacterium sp. TMT4-31]